MWNMTHSSGNTSTLPSIWYDEYNVIDVDARGDLYITKNTTPWGLGGFQEPSMLPIGKMRPKTFPLLLPSPPKELEDL